MGQAEGYRNLMFDRRIVRGNTYAREDVLPVTAQEHPVDLQRKAEKRRAREARKRQSELEHRTKSPPPVDGRWHQPVQTELYLEEITDRIEESEAVCQTDAWMDRPPTPLFVPIVDVADFKGFSFVNRHVDFWLFLDFSSEDSSKRPTLESNKQISTPH